MSRRSSLFPHIEPYETGRLPVGGGHALYYERCGARDGAPLVFLHGGPGSGASARHRRYYDPQAWNITLYDQRGCGRSRPLFSLEENTTAHLIEDLEALRVHLGLKRWTVFGPSWGSTLAIAYAQAHPDRVDALVIEGVFLGTRAEIDWFHSANGAGAVHPEALARLLEGAPQDFASPAAFQRWALDQMRDELARGRPALDALSIPNAQADALSASWLYRWSAYEETLSHLEISPEEIRAGFALNGADWLTAHSLLEAWYFVHDCFLAPGQLLAEAERLTMPVHIIQSRYDMVCPARAAFELHEAAPSARLYWVDRSGHVMGEAAHAVVRRVFEALAEAR